MKSPHISNTSTTCGGTALPTVRRGRSHGLRSLLGCALLLSTLASGCGEDNAGSLPLALVREFVDAFQVKDLQTLTGLLSPDVVWELKTSTTGEPEVYTGTDGATAFLTGLFDTFESTAFSHTAYFESDEFVFLEFTTDMRTPAGEPYRNHYLIKVETDGPYITHIEDYFNPIVTARTLGIDVCPADPVQAH